MTDLLKQIEVPKELRFNRHEAAKYQMEQLRKKVNNYFLCEIYGLIIWFLLYIIDRRANRC